MYWIQTNYNLNNILRVKDILDDCHSKDIDQIIVGDEGPFSWLEFENYRPSYDIQILYALYKPFQGANVLWVLKNDILKNASRLEKAFEQQTFSTINNEDVLPIFIPDSEWDDASIEQDKKRFKDLYSYFENIRLGETNQNIEKVELLTPKSRDRVLPLQRVRYLEPTDKEITDVRRYVNGEKKIEASFDAFLKPPKFLEDRFHKTKYFLQQINSYVSTQQASKMELWDEQKIRNIQVIDHNRFFTRPLKLPEDSWEQKKIILLCTKAGIGFKRVYKNSSCYNEALKHLKKELTTVVESQFYDYFLVIEDIVKQAKNEKIRTNIRGSALGSVMAYCLGITGIDPLKFNLKFERFLNPYRKNKPDVDIEMPASKMAKMTERIREKYGEQNVAKILSFNNFGLKNAVRYIRMYQDVHEPIENQLPNGLKEPEKYFNTAEGNQLKQKLKDHNHWKIVEEAKKLADIPHNISVQPSGVVINKGVPNIPTRIVDGERVIQMTSTVQGLESFSFNKIDLLSSRALEKLEMMWSIVKTNDKKKFHYKDKKTYQFLSRGNKNFIFQLKSKGIQQAFEAIQPQNLHDIMMGLSLYRPGPKQQLQQFIQNRQNHNTLLKNDKGQPIKGTEVLQDIVQETWGIIIFQEQVMEIARRWANYTLGEADLLRDIMSKKRSDEMKTEKEKFFRRSKDNKRDIEASKAVFKLIEKFSEYGFNKSHAAGYALITYETAYLKANFPKIFYVCELNDEIKNFNRTKEVMQEVQEQNFDVEPASIKKSKKYFAIKEDTIIQGMLNIRGIGEADIKNIQQIKKQVDLSKVNDKKREKLLGKQTTKILNNVNFFN